MANISHELRTPLNGIIGFADLALSAQPEAVQRDYLEHVRSSGHNLLAIINDILDFSKIEAGMLNIEHIPFELGALIQETTELLAVKAFEKKVELICDIDPHLPPVFFGDPLRIRQVFTNLLSNAVKFTQSGEIMIAVNGEPILTEQGKRLLQVRISVKDSGIGIPADKLDAIFSSFIQADSSTTRRYGGTGLGLAIAKSLVSLMGGTMTVRSEEGTGSTFTAFINLDYGDGQTGEPLFSTSGIRQVLVVDDSLTNCRLIHGIFAFFGVDCTITTSGRHALLIVADAADHNEHFDLIITDQQMPGMEGMTLIRELKKVMGGHE